MEGQEILPLVKNLLSMLLLPFYTACLFVAWVTAGDIEWGLWRWCYKKDVHAALKIEDNDIERCHSIAPGDSPAYFEAARVWAAVSVPALFLSVCFSLYVQTLEAGKRCTSKVLLTFLPALIGVTAPVLVALHYQDDDRWKHSSPALHRGFWISTAIFACEFLLCCCQTCVWARHADRRCCLPAPSPPSPRPRRRLSTASSISIDGKKRMTLFHTGGVSADREPPAGPPCLQPRCPTGSGAPTSTQPAVPGPAGQPPGPHRSWNRRPAERPVTPRSPVTLGPHHWAPRVSDHRDGRASSGGQPLGQVGQADECVPREAAGVRRGRWGRQGDVGVLRVEDPPTGRLVFWL